MACTLWLLVLFVLVFPPAVNGHEACYNDSWTYHDHTYSCFRLFESDKTWTEARDNCSEIQLGSTYGVITHLAKIDDSDTSDFVKTLFPIPLWSAWIGLYFNTDQNGYRWDGYPDEIPKYTDPRWLFTTLPYMAIYIDSWRGLDSDFEDDFVCQHSSKKIRVVTCAQQVQANGLNITCTSDESPVIAKCEWTYKYDGEPNFRVWTSLNDPRHESHTERPGGKPSYTTACSVASSNFNVGILTIKMKMYPDISGINLSNNERALTVGSLDNIFIAKPQEPTFYSSTTNINGSDLILVQGSNNNIILTCFILTGSPAVYSTSIDCESPISDRTFPSTSVSHSNSVIIGQVRRDMDGKKCTCWGNHVTGNTDISTLTFRVITKPQEPTFSLPSMSINGSDLILVQGSNNSIILTCSITTGSPAVYSTSMDCESPINDSTLPIVNVSQSYSLTIGQVRRDMDGKKCTCWGNHVTGNTDISILTFRVITMPTTVLCQSDLHPTGLQVSCQIDKIYPQALSMWSYRQENEQNFNPVSADECSHESYTDSDGFLYHNSSCFMTLTNDTMTFTTGELIVQVTVNPNVEGIDKAVTSNAFITVQETVNIDQPDKPQFKLLDNTVQASSPIHFHDNDRIDISCEVQSGNPPVHSVTLSCEFPFKDSDEDNKHTVSGSTYVMDEIASCNMARKSCTCIGNHLTGPIESSSLTFNVTYAQPKSPASSSCLSTGIIIGLILASDVVAIILTISCMIAFRKLRERNKYKSKETSGDGHVNVGFHKPEQEATGSGYDGVSEDASFPGKDLPALSTKMAKKDDYEGEELQSIDTTMHEAIQQKEEKKDGERAENENYDILHADDPSYINLKREPSRQYMTMDDQDPYHVYESPS